MIRSRHLAVGSSQVETYEAARNGMLASTTSGCPSRTSAGGRISADDTAGPIQVEVVGELFGQPAGEQQTPCASALRLPIGNLPSPT
ncbi:hypothetical protein BIV23_34940 [Streptomyces monashensis]|uniref:Uncharacterized protein n=1 Tax=Streptomyces monashensis TaxID=1678012 RepID=A0A1S2PNF6_9ACTN|nr:hypothetical protein BIV23_34940 [Streptomyces monashensis]